MNRTIILMHLYSENSILNVAGCGKKWYYDQIVYWPTTNPVDNAPCI